MCKSKEVNIIGAGIAGCECAYILAKNNIKVNLYEMKKIKKTPAHKSNNFAELVCSNSLKSGLITNACGLLKKEMEILDSLVIKSAYLNKVPAGQALAVDRNNFSKYITDVIKSMDNINIVDLEVVDINQLEGIIVIATGPLTSESLLENIAEIIGSKFLYFYDAAAPIIEADSIDMSIAYSMDRYKKGDSDYLNLPMNKEEYYNFYNLLVTAESANRHEFDKLLLFEGCMPIEEMAKRGEKTLTYGPLKPVGLDNPITGKKNYAVVQLRAENMEKTMYNLVGFQTSLKFKEQERVFRSIPGLKNADFVRYGVMHRNTYINSSKILNKKFELKNKPNIYFAGQISGVEGYVESAASGLMIAYNILAKLNGKINIEFPDTTMCGSLAKYISTDNKDFQPMNANFSIIRQFDKKIKDKKLKYEMYANRAIEDMKKIKMDLDKL